VTYPNHLIREKNGQSVSQLKKSETKVIVEAVGQLVLVPLLATEYVSIVEMALIKEEFQPKIY